MLILTTKGTELSFAEVGNLQIVYAKPDSTDIDLIKLLKTLSEPKDKQPSSTNS